MPAIGSKDITVYVWSTPSVRPPVVREYLYFSWPICLYVVDAF